MKSHPFRPASVLCGALCAALAAPPVWPAVPASNGLLAFAKVPLERLARQRGGFVGAEGMRLQLNLNLRQMVYVNEQLMSETRINLAELTATTQSDMSSLREQLQGQREAIRAETEALAQSIGQTAAEVSGPTLTGAPSEGVQAPVPVTPVLPAAPAATLPASTGSVSNTSTVSTTPVSPVSVPPVTPSQSPTSSGASAVVPTASTASTTAPSGPSVETPAAVISTAPAPGVTVHQVSSSDTAATTSEQSHERAVVVQNGSNNRVDFNALSGIRGGTLTIIQNSLNNQSLRHVMEVDVTLSGLRNLRTLEQLGGLNLQLRGSGR